MATVPTLPEVRSYLKVPATVLSDVELQDMLDAAIADQSARCTWGPTATTGAGRRLPPGTMAHNTRQDPTQKPSVWTRPTGPTRPTTTPPPLRMALFRRVQREVAARNLPARCGRARCGRYGPSRIPAYDAQIEMHELPYRRQVLA